MNANELADELERPNNWQQENNFNNQAATMLRQQQAEIEALKGGFFDWSGYAKTLTDEEIMNIFNNWTNNKQEHNLPANNQNYFYQEMREFARAILRKASEK